MQLPNMADWSRIPKDLLESIFKRVENDLMDCLSFSAVCTQWRLIALEEGRHAVPHIMSIVFHDDKDGVNVGNFFSLSSPNNLYKFRLPDIQGKRCCGSFKGLIVTLDTNSGDLYLRNPISGSQILLASPSVLTIEQQESGPISKVLVSSSLSSNEDYVILVFRFASKKVYFCKKGDEKWTTLEVKYGSVRSVTYYREKLYTVVSSGIIQVFDLQKPEFKGSVIKITQPDFTIRELGELLRYFADVKHLDAPTQYGENGRFRMVYLVKVPEDELLMVVRYVVSADWPYDTVGFKVFKLVEGVGDWNEIESLGERVLFLGTNSVCLKAHDVPQCQANSIYCTDCKDSNGWNNIGVFNMEDRSIKLMYENHPFKHSRTTWVTPNLQL